MPFKDIEMT